MYLDETKRKAALAAIAAAKDVDALEALRVKHLGRKSELARALTALGALPAAERPEAGRRLNEAKRALEEAIAARERELRAVSLVGALQSERVDVSLPGRRVRVGRHHPISATMREVVRIFAGMGFEAVEGPEVEWDRYNFEMLNIPKGHPARDLQATFWVSNPFGDDPERPMLLRTHTSPMQARVMEQRQPPIRVIVPGRCYRYEAVDPSHEAVFFQFEGLAIDEQLTMADLKGVLYSFARQMFGVDRKVRFRVDYFPYVEPGADMSIDCFICDGKGCRTCAGTGWLEFVGAGMVHPAVLRNVGYDPERYQGFAFGAGIERVAMMRTGVADMRVFAQNDVRFLRQWQVVS